MFQICIIPRTDNPNLPSIVLTYKTREKAHKKQEFLHKAMESNGCVLSLHDDYSYIASIRPEDILHVLLIDLEHAETCRLEKNLHTARVGKRLGARVTENPEEMELLRTLNPPQQEQPQFPVRSKIIQ